MKIHLIDGTTNYSVTILAAHQRSPQGDEVKQSDHDLPKLAAPAQRALHGAGITKLEQLTRISEAELMQLHGIGRNVLATLRMTLAEHGL